MASRPRKNQSGSYFITWSNTDKNPPQKVETLKTKSKPEADKRAQALQQLYDSGYHDPWEKTWHKNRRIRGFVMTGVIDLRQLAQQTVMSVPTMEAVEEYILEKAASDWTGQTLHNYPLTLRRMARSLPPNADKITRQHLLKILSKYDNDNTYSYYASILNTFVKWLGKYGIEIETIKTRTTPTNIPEWIYNDRLEEICNSKLDYIKKTRKFYSGEQTQRWMVLAWLLMRFTGMRPGELIRIRKDDVDLETQEIIIGSWFKTKTKHPRKVPIFDEVVPLVELLLDPAFRKVENMDRLLFGRSKNAQIKLRKEFNKHSEGLTLYWLRHTFAMWYLTRPTDHAAMHFYRLKKYMGHSKLNQTNNYLDALPYKMDESKLQDVSFLPKLLEKVLSV